MHEILSDYEVFNSPQCCNLSKLILLCMVNIQNSATKLVITCSLGRLLYKESLISLKLHTLKYRRLHGEVFKIVHDICDEKSHLHYTAIILQ